MINSEGIVLGNGIHIRWDEVRSVSGYKLDAIAEVISFVVLDFDTGEFLELPDSDECYPALLEGLGRYLPLPPDWTSPLMAMGPDDQPVLLWSRA